jgi:aspartate racemase
LSDSPEARCLGLVGGLGPGATIHYYRELIAAHTAQGCVPRLLIVHADLDRVLGAVKAGDLAGLAQYLGGLTRQLAEAGAELAAIAAITPHICAPNLVRLSPLPLIDLVEAVARAIETRGLRRVALFGTRVTVETGMFGRLGEVTVVAPEPDELGAIHDTYLQIVRAGRGTEEHYETLRRIAHRLCERDQAEAIVLAGTELSLLFDEANTDFPAIDCTRVHLDAIMGRLIDRQF